MRLEGSSFVIRPHRLGDEESLVRYANNRKIWRMLPDRFPSPYTLQDALSLIEAWQRTPDLITDYAIARSDEVIGGIRLTPFSGNARLTGEIGYWLGESFWRQGITTEAVRLISQYGFEELGLIRLQARVFEGNAASMRVLEKAGYTLEARLAKSIIKEDHIIDEFQYVLLK